MREWIVALLSGRLSRRQRGVAECLKSNLPLPIGDASYSSLSRIGKDTNRSAAFIGDWVKCLKDIVGQTKRDPYQQTEQLAVLQNEYLAANNDSIIDQVADS